MTWLEIEYDENLHVEKLLCFDDGSEEESSDEEQVIIEDDEDFVRFEEIDKEIQELKNELVELELESQIEFSTIVFYMTWKGWASG